jgi:23S rRNA (cytosine1962-C5)-methyltransferase
VSTAAEAPQDLQTLFLRKGAERRLRSGHLWVYSNEIDTARSALKQFSAGDLVRVCSSNGDTLGSAYMEPQALICARLYAPGQDRALSVELLQARIASAQAARDGVFGQPFYRLIYGDSDLLPGVVVDRFGDYLVLQLNNASIERYQQAVVTALVAQLQPAGILLRADSRSRRDAGLSTDVAVVYGDVPTEVELEENGVRFIAPLHAGQKTGWFYDHRMARARLTDYVRDADVLDVYSYIGGWGVQAAAFGARSVVCVDSSEVALELAQRNAELNAAGERLTTRCGNATAVMDALFASGDRFDVVVLDPPAFIQRRKDIKKGIAAYRKNYEAGLRLLRPGGVLVAGSCSMHLSRGDLFYALQGAALRAGCQLRVVEQGAQGPDHPIHPAIPETEYLKAVFARRD